MPRNPEPLDHGPCIQIEAALSTLPFLPGRRPFRLRD